jgi:hypothetical protein
MALDANLEFVSSLLVATVIGLLVRREIYKKLPLFSSYLVWLLLVYGASLVVGSRYPAYYQRIFVVASIIDAAFMVCVLVELSMAVLSPIRASLPRWTIFGVAGVLVVAFAAIWPFAKPPGFSAMQPLSQIQVHLETTTAILRILFFLALAGSSKWLSLGWRDRELQVGTGLGFYSFVTLSVSLLHMNIQITSDALRTYHMLDRAVVIGYILSLMYWGVSFAQKVPERREFTPQMQGFLLALAGNAQTTRAAMRSSEFRKDKVRH